MKKENKITSSKKKKAFSLFEENNLIQAKSLYAKVCELDPIDAEAWFFLGIINSKLGFDEDAEQCLKRVVSLQPRRPEVHFNLGNILNQRDKAAEAEAAYREALHLKPNFVAAHMNLATLLKKQGRYDESLTEHRETVLLEPTHADAHFNLGNLLKDMGHFEEAESSYREALRLNPAFAEAFDNLGILLRGQGRFKEALEAHRHMVRIKPELPAAYLGLGIDLERMGWFKEAIAAYADALQIKPDYFEAWIHRAISLAHLGQLDDALVSYRRAQSIDPANIQAKIGEALIFEMQGDFEQSYALLQPFLKMDNPDGFAVMTFARLCRPLHLYDEGISHLESYIKRNEQHMENSARAAIHFELGHLYDAKRAYDVAFPHFERGNELLKQATHIFDPQKFKQEIDVLIRTFSSDFMKTAPRASTTSQRPVFILGMPRSGTSLVELILASHPLVSGGGELSEMEDIAWDMPAMLEGRVPYPACLANVTNNHLDQMAARYLNRITSISSDAPHVTDKMPNNFLHLGLINLLFPEAHVIHCVRDPLDTCLSCYFQDFGDRLTFSQDLTVLGAYYRQYERLMAHWSNVLDIAIMKVEYESLVRDQEGISRQLVEFCGLEWDKRCLRYYDEKLVMLTASHDQVRQPIYNKSVSRWHNYESFIGPLINALSNE